MKNLSETEKANIRARVDAGVRVNHTPGKRSILSLGGKNYKILHNEQGKVTPAGRYYYWAW